MFKTRIGRLGAALCTPALLLGAVTLAPGTALAASPATFTTDVDGVKVNANHYQSKCDVYLDGGPSGAQLAAGTYVFFVLAPSGQANPNNPSTLLSSDSNAARTFTVNADGDITNPGAHDTSTDLTDGDVLIQLCQYATTPNPGGVYIAAICPADNITPSGCKYDAFKVKDDDTMIEGGDDLTAIKSANPTFTQTFDYSITKAVDRTYVQQSGGSATFNYMVVATKGAAVDSAFVVSGQVTVFNTNDTTVTDVSVSDNILVIADETCAVTGGSTTIAAHDQATFNYSCTLPSATAATTGMNEATVNWNAASINSLNNSTTAQAGFDFSTATPTVVGDCTTVTDTFGLSGTTGTPTTLGRICASRTFTYARTIAIPSSGCLTYNNTAALSDGDTAGASVTVCRTNSDGFTMGYWANKNGQKRINDNAAGLCTYLAAYPNVLTLPSPCTASSLKGYVLTTIRAAEASGVNGGAPMFKGQFLATALSAYFSTNLANTYVVVPGSLLGTGNCIKVLDLLVAANASYSTLAAPGNKTNFMLVKDVFDRINNNTALTCSP